MISSQEDRVAVVFAGGKSSRMGQDKSLMPFGGYDTMAEYQYRRLSEIFDRVYISTKEAKFNFQAPLIYDRFPQSSPLVALISIFEEISDDNIFILSVDAPLVTENIIDRLYINVDNSQTTIAETPRGYEPLCGAYHRSIVEVAKRLLSEDNHRLTTLLKDSNTQYIFFNDTKPFLNLNFIEDYNLLQKM